MSDLEWQTIKTEPVADFGVFKVAITSARSPRTGQVMDFHLIRRRDAVQAVAFTEDDKVILVEQFRHGVQHAALEFPAGTADEGEAAVQAAARELREETGYEAQRHEVLGVIEPDSAMESMRITVVAAFGCTATADRNLDDGEAIRVHVVPAAEVDGFIRSGRMTLAPAIAAWYLWKMRTAS